MRLNYHRVGWLMAFSLLVCGAGLLFLLCLLREERGQYQSELSYTQAQVLAQEAQLLLQQGRGVEAVPLAILAGELGMFSSTVNQVLSDLVQHPHITNQYPSPSKLYGAWDLNIHPDGEQIAYILTDTRRLWIDKLGDSQPIDTGFEGSTPVFSPDGHHLVMLDRDMRNVMIFDVGNWRNHRSLAFGGNVFSTRFSPSGDYLIIGGHQSTWIYDMRSHQFLHKIDQAYVDWIFSPDERTFYALTESGYPASVLKGYRVADLSEVLDFQVPDRIVKLVINPYLEEMVFITDTGRIYGTSYLLGEVSINNVETATYSLDGRFLILSNGYHGDLVVWDGIQTYRMNGYGGKQILLDQDGVHFYIAPTQNGIARVSLQVDLGYESITSNQIANDFVAQDHQYQLVGVFRNRYRNLDTGKMVWDLEQVIDNDPETDSYYPDHLNLDDAQFIRFLEKWMTNDLKPQAIYVHPESGRVLIKHGDKLFLPDMPPRHLMIRNVSDRWDFLLPSTTDQNLIAYYQGKIVTADQKTIRLYDQNFKELLQVSVPDIHQIANIGFDEQGNIRFVYQTVTHVIYQVFDGQTGEILQTFKMPFMTIFDSPLSVRFDLDRGLFVPQGATNSVVLVELSTGRILHRVNLFESMVFPLWLDETGRVMFSTYEIEKVLRIENPSVDQMMDHLYADYYFDLLTCDQLIQYDVSCELLETFQPRLVPTYTPLPRFVTPVPFSYYQLTATPVMPDIDLSLPSITPTPDID